MSKENNESKKNEKCAELKKQLNDIRKKINGIAKDKNNDNTKLKSLRDDHNILADEFNKECSWTGRTVKRIGSDEVECELLDI